MIPYFKQHILNFESDKKLEILEETTEKEMKESLSKTIVNSINSKLDKRVIKNIDFDF